MPVDEPVYSKSKSGWAFKAVMAVAAAGFAMVILAGCGGSPTPSNIPTTEPTPIVTTLSSPTPSETTPITLTPEPTKPSPSTIPITTQVQLADLVANSVSKITDGHKIAVNYRNSGNIAASNVDLSLNYGNTVTANWTANLAAGGIEDKIFSIDNDIIPKLVKIAAWRPGSTNLTLKINSTSGVPEISASNNATTGYNLIIARAFDPSIKVDDYTKIITAANRKIEVTDKLLAGPLKPVKAAGFDPSKVIVTYKSPDVFNEEYKTLTKGGVIGDFRGGAFVRDVVVNGRWNGQEEIVVREGTFAQTWGSEGREWMIAALMQLNHNGVIAAQTILGGEQYGDIGKCYVLAWGIENNIITNRNISYEVKNFGFAELILKPTSELFFKGLQVPIALSAKFGYPNGGAPSNLWLDEALKISKMPDPTSYLQANYDSTASINWEEYKSFMYAYSMSDSKQTPLSESTSRIISPHTTGTYTYDYLLAQADAVLYPLKR